MARGALRDFGALTRPARPRKVEVVHARPAQECGNDRIAEVHRTTTGSVFSLRAVATTSGSGLVTFGIQLLSSVFSDCRASSD